VATYRIDIELDGIAFAHVEAVATRRQSPSPSASFW
jgi:hypothetical protein